MSEKPLERLEQFAIDVILERRYGKRAALLRVFLSFLAWIYGGVMALRAWAYRTHLLRSHAPGCLVISVGNLTVGGTGKTPVVEKIARTLTESGRRVAILSRGYKSRPRSWRERMKLKWQRLHTPELLDPPRVVSDGQTLLLDSATGGDEPFMLASNLKNVAVLVDKDRVKSARYATRQMNIDTLLLDDGYQYLSIPERLNILLVDRTAPFGIQSIQGNSGNHSGHILPRGFLREPKEHLKRGDVIFLTKCDGSDLTELKDELRRYNRHAEILECAHAPLYLQDLYTDERIPLEYLEGKPVGALCGIAVPESFENGLARLGAEIIYSRAYADHHRFSEQEILNAIARTRARGGHALITTEKDAVRIPRVSRKGMPVYFLRVEMQLLGGQETLEEAILRICGMPIPSLV